jgi:SpoVK/Ycf46/Vps4 family AAA+-type ATPase
MPGQCADIRTPSNQPSSKPPWLHARARHTHARTRARTRHTHPQALLARQTTGFSGADLANLVNEAALLAAKQGADAITPAMMDYAHDKVCVCVFVAVCVAAVQAGTWPCRHVRTRMSSRNAFDSPFQSLTTCTHTRTRTHAHTHTHTHTHMKHT